MQLIMEEEVRQLAGERRQRRQPEQVHRWGREGGFHVVHVQNANIQRPRVRSREGHEEKLGSYEFFRRNEPLDEAVWDKRLLGLSTRNYGRAARQFAESYGIEKSAVSEDLITVSRPKVEHMGTSSTRILTTPRNDALLACRLYDLPSESPGVSRSHGLDSLTAGKCTKCSPMLVRGACPEDYLSYPRETLRHRD